MIEGNKKNQKVHQAKKAFSCPQDEDYKSLLLQTELLKAVCYYLNVRELGRISCVCQSFRRIIDEGAFWNHLLPFGFVEETREHLKDRPKAICCLWWRIFANHSLSLSNQVSAIADLRKFSQEQLLDASFVHVEKSFLIVKSEQDFLLGVKKTPFEQIVKKDSTRIWHHNKKFDRSEEVLEKISLYEDEDGFSFYVGEEESMGMFYDAKENFHQGKTLAELCENVYLPTSWKSAQPWHRGLQKLRKIGIISPYWEICHIRKYVSQALLPYLEMEEEFRRLSALFGKLLFFSTTL